MEARLINNEHHYLNNQKLADDPNFENCLKTILEPPLLETIKVCNTNCVPVQFSTLVNISQLTVCSQYDYQLCAFSIWKKYSIDPNLLKCFTSSEKFTYYTGYVQTKHGITLHPQYYAEDHQKKKVL